MSTITNILGTDNITDSREVINTNFDNLNADKLEAGAIADFETTTQLNARDVANRDRSNHTGTQTASTISDFDAEVSNNTDVSANTTARHTHSNKTILDQIANDPVETITAGTNVSVSRTGNNVTINATGGGGGATALDDLTDVIITTPVSGQALTYNGSQWTNSTPAGGGDMLKSVYDTDNDGIVNQADVITNQGALATLSSVDTAQITNKAVTNTKLADMNSNTLKGRLSENGTPQDVAMADLPISTATQSALDGKQNILSEGAFVDGDKTKLDSIEAGAEVNVNADWNSASGDSQILNKPNIPDNTDYVDLTTNQAIAGIKTFSSSPIVPTPTNDMEVATKKYVDDNAGGGGSVTTLDTLEITGTQYVGVVSNYRVGQGGIMSKFSAYLGTGNTGASFIVYLKKNGTTVATATITVGNTSNVTTTFSDATLTEGDLITYEIGQIGSIIAGSDLTLILNLS